MLAEDLHRQENPRSAAIAAAERPRSDSQLWRRAHVARNLQSLAPLLRETARRFENTCQQFE
jgi:hypothetical protein